MSKSLTIAVTGAGALLGQGIIRSLRRMNPCPRIVGADVSALSAGLFWCDAAHLIPKAEDPGYISAIQRLLDRERPDVLLIGTDVELPPLAAARVILETDYGCKVLVSSPEVVRIADDKYATAHFMRDCGFAAPCSAIPEQQDAIKTMIARHGFPLIVKPRNGARSFGVSKVNDAKALETAMASLRNPVVQECIGDDACEYTASGLYFDGRCDGAIVMRRDLRDGNTYRAFVETSPALTEIVCEWTRALKPYGPANFQFRLDRDGKPKVFEINARFSGTTPLRAACGFNEVEMCVRHLVLNEPIAQPEIRPLTILRHWEETVVQEQVVATVAAI